MSKTHGKLKGRVVKVNALSSQDRSRMFELMCKYYDKVELSAFDRDLAEKSAVILLQDKKDKIQGFSTLKTVEATVGGRAHRGIFSGDTILEAQFWGSRVLGNTFLKHLFIECVKRPWRPLYWLLMSKGYKTYLLMSNNFSEHYPRYERATPAPAQQLLNSFYGQLFPKYYQAESGLIDFQDKTMRLKSGVAPISMDLLSNDRIAFFQNRNPEWSSGTELACIARMTLGMPVYYFFKSLLKLRVVKSLQALTQGRGRVKPS